MSAYTGIPLTTSLSAQDSIGDEDEPTVKNNLEETVHEAKRVKPQNLQNSQTAFQQFCKNNQQDYLFEGHTALSLMALWLSSYC